MTLYPLKFHTRFVRKIWGGRSLEAALGKSLPANASIGESWELYDFPPGATGPDALTAADDPAGWISSIVNNGPHAGQTLHALLQADSALILGKCKPTSSAAGAQFPLLVKFLDARDDLSVQVHPPADYAGRHANSYLKNEAWHILACDAAARLLLGTKPGVTREQFGLALHNGGVENLVHAVPVKVGETYYLPSGTLHALGGGIVAYEVQTPSDTTYRVYDFNRVDAATGKPRTLNLAQAMDCIQFDVDALKNRTPATAGDATLARAPQWLLQQATLPAGGKRYLEHADGPIVATVARGAGSFESFGRREAFATGETLLLPPSPRTIVETTSPTRLLLAAVPPLDVDALRPRE